MEARATVFQRTSRVPLGRRWRLCGTVNGAMKAVGASSWAKGLVSREVKESANISVLKEF